MQEMNLATVASDHQFAIGPLGISVSADQKFEGELFEDGVAGTPTSLSQYDATTNQLKFFRESSTPTDIINCDISGNLVSRPADVGVDRVSYEWDAENRLRKVNAGATFEAFYDAFGQRVKTLGAGGAQTRYFYSSDGELLFEEGGVSQFSGLLYLTTDHLGSTRMLIKPDGTVMGRIDYEPFGLEIASASRSAQGYASGSQILRNKFSGKERDAETGLDYFGARYFSGAQGRYTTPDWSENPEPVPYADFSDPQTLNLYTYARNNPLSVTDPDGHCPWCLGALIGGAGGVGAYYLTQRATNQPMPRNARLVDPGLPFHITQRGNRHVDVFLSPEDRTVYLDLMRHQLADADVSVLAFCLMTNHVHWLVVPNRPACYNCVLQSQSGDETPPSIKNTENEPG
ncbi:MAG: transposase [Bryobacterales bacterium]|nr:transposase [Bryobacterales bacterium]